MSNEKKKFEVRSYNDDKTERNPCCIVDAPTTREAAEAFVKAQHAPGEPEEVFNLTIFDGDQTVTKWRVHVSRLNETYAAQLRKPLGCQRRDTTRGASPSLPCL